MIPQIYIYEKNFFRSVAYFLRTVNFTLISWFSLSRSSDESCFYFSHDKANISKTRTTLMSATRNEIF